MRFCVPGTVMDRAGRVKLAFLICRPTYLIDSQAFDLFLHKWEMAVRGTAASAQCAPHPRAECAALHDNFGGINDWPVGRSAGAAGIGAEILA